MSDTHAEPDVTSPVNMADFAVPGGAWSPPVPAQTVGPTHPGSIGGQADGTVVMPYVNQANTEIRVSYNRGYLSPVFVDALVAPLAGLPKLGVGSLRTCTDLQGRLHVAWYSIENSAGDCGIWYARRDPTGVPGTWAVAPSLVKITRTGPSWGTPGYKVVSLSASPRGRVHLLWARNGVGARVSWSDDGQHWAEPVVPPAPQGVSDATDFVIGAGGGDVFFVGWFQRMPNDIFVQMHSPSGVWSPPRNASLRYGSGQDYSPRFAVCPDGALRLLWTGFATPTSPRTDGYYREWAAVGGWDPRIVKLWTNSGSGNSRALEAVVDAQGVTHVVWDDDSGRPVGAVAVLYSRGQGSTWTMPQNICPLLGYTSVNRYPDLALGPIPGGIGLHVSLNSNARGPFVNYYTSIPL